MALILFTCINCENKYNYLTGDVDERVCYKCLNKYDEYAMTHTAYRDD